MRYAGVSKGRRHAVTDLLQDRRSHIGTIAEEVFGYEVEAARQTANLGYMARVMTQVTLPHSRPTTNEYTRHNGRMKLSMWSPEHIGLPYGGVPRLLIGLFGFERGFGVEVVGSL